MRTWVFINLGELIGAILLVSRVVGLYRGVNLHMGDTCIIPQSARMGFQKFRGANRSHFASLKELLDYTGV